LRKKIRLILEKPQYAKRNGCFFTENASRFSADMVDPVGLDRSQPGLFTEWLLPIGHRSNRQDSVWQKQLTSDSFPLKETALQTI
jgi:hypothetical protein